MSKLRVDSILVLLGKIYTAGVSIILLPYFLEVLGKEQYGLIGSFVVLQACMQILDAGISGVLTRQSIVTQKNLISFELFLNKLKYILLLFTFIAFLLVFFGFYFSERYSVNWFNSTLKDSVIISSVSSMFLIFTLKYLQGPIKSLLLSYEKQRALALFDVLYAMFSGPVVLYLITTIDGDIVDYFNIQIAVALASLCIIAIYAWRQTNLVRHRLAGMAIDEEVVATNFSDILKFGLQLSLLSMLWVIVNQSDKLTLTKYMELSEYSFYAISVSILGGVNVFVGTMVQTVRPRLVSLYNHQDYLSFAKLFKQSVIVIISLLVPLIVFLSFFGDTLLIEWTSNSELATKVMKYLPYLLVGSLFVSLSEFSFMILYSTGNLKSHTIFYTIVSIFIIPLNVLVASRYLGEGSAMLFMVVNALLFLTWSMYNIRKNLNRSGRVFLLAIFLSLSISIVMLIFNLNINTENSLLNIFYQVIFGLMSVFLSYFFVNKVASRIDLNVLEKV